MGSYPRLVFVKKCVSGMLKVNSETNTLYSAVSRVVQEWHRDGNSRTVDGRRCLTYTFCSGKMKPEGPHQDNSKEQWQQREVKQSASSMLPLSMMEDDMKRI